MQYDADHRLIGIQEPFGLSLAFSYDAAGDRTQVADNFGGVTQSVYDANGQLTSRTFSGPASRRCVSTRPTTPPAT